MEYLSKNTSSIQAIQQIIVEKDYDKLLKNNPYSEKTEIEVNDFIKEEILEKEYDYFD